MGLMRAPQTEHFIVVVCRPTFSKKKKDLSPKGEDEPMANLKKLYKKAHDLTGGKKKIDIAQHNESCAALLDVLAKEKFSTVLAVLEGRK